MINFRYHVVAVAAVFVAVVVGLAVGTAALHGPATGPVRDRVARVSAENAELQQRLDQVGGEVGVRERFVEEAAPQLLAGRLASAKVLVLATDSGADLADGVVAKLAMAGATVTGTVAVTDRFVDPGRSADLLDLATAALPPSVVEGLPQGSDGAAISAALLAAVLLTRTPAVTDDDRRAVLVAYQSQGFIELPSLDIAAADAVVLVGGTAGGALLALVGELDRVGHLVVATDGEGGSDDLVAVVRATFPTTSTVDNVDRQAGQAVVALAIAAELAGHAGHYGEGPDTDVIPAAMP